MEILRKTLAKNAPLKATYHWLRSRAMSAVYHVSPELLGRLRYWAAWGEWPDFENPTTFDEKLLWLNFYWRHPLTTECADKFTLRGYVERHGLGDLLPRVYGVYETVEDIDFEALPERFVLKCTHGCKCNIFSWRKVDLDFAGAKQDLSRWMATDYSALLGELQYAGMKPRIICEEFLDDGAGQLPTDYKLYCFEGHVHCILVCSGRGVNDNACFNYLDRGWNPLPYVKESLASRRRIARPAGYEEMISAAEKLSAPFPFVRVDFYCVQDRPVLGEMTFTPSACIDTSHTVVATKALGDLIKLPDRILHSEHD